MRFSRKLFFLGLTAPVAILTAGGVACTFQKPVVSEIDPRRPSPIIVSAVKAHLSDGSTIIYAHGLRLSHDTVVTVGQQFALGSSTGVASRPMPLDSIIGMEAFDAGVEKGKTLLATAALIPVVAVGVAAAAVAIFGSCPTFYVDSAGTQVLQAEGFSYSIAPLFEQRDVDRLRVSPTPDGKVVLYVRNEALETHYINHLELIEVSHQPSEKVLPDQHGLPVAVMNAGSPASIFDRAGRNISGAVRNSDGRVYVTSDETLTRISRSDFDDYIDLTVPAPKHSDSVAVMLDMRNSLLNTVLLYDEILGNQGLQSLDYLGRNLGRIGNVVELGRWYAKRMGMRISVRDGAAYRQVARIGDTGPIAFHNVAVLVPAIRSGGDSVRVRLTFVADDWRIDAINVATDWRRPQSRIVPVSRVRMPQAAQDSAAMESLRQADETYLTTTPGQAFSAEFDVGTGRSSSRTYLLGSQGYYTEWVRGNWIKGANGKPFTPNDAALVDAIHAWRAKHVDMERQFYSSQISAR